jgi:hypothetical protein
VVAGGRSGGKVSAKIKLVHERFAQKRVTSLHVFRMIYKLIFI